MTKDSIEDALFPVAVIVLILTVGKLIFDYMDDIHCRHGAISECRDYEPLDTRLKCQSEMARICNGEDTVLSVSINGGAYD